MQISATKIINGFAANKPTDLILKTVESMEFILRV